MCIFNTKIIQYSPLIRSLRMNSESIHVSSHLKVVYLCLGILLLREGS